MVDNFKDLYRVLGVSRGATENEVQLAFRKLAKETHPDKFSDQEEKVVAEAKMKVITSAYDVLKRPESRKKYELSYDQFWVESKGGYSWNLYTNYFGGKNMVDFMNEWDDMWREI